ncbi:MAG: aminopeptidase [Sedimentisphaerales bacterium]|jgi:leucyl aminopeptidase (aminopeptidase T)|nr:aminopeptidase [Sedimentisphaerales bacterium]
MAAPIDPIQIGARQAVRNCARVRPGEHVVVVTDLQTSDLAQAIIREVDGVGATTTRFLMEDLGPRPEDGSQPLPFPASIEQALSMAQVSFYVAQCKKGELSSFRRPMLAAVERYRLRHAHMPGFTARMMSEGMAADYKQIQAITRAVYQIVRQAEWIKVTTPAGTDLTVTFDRSIRWIPSDGLITEDHWTNLPDGEVFTAPASADGVVVVDGCLGDFFSERYGLLKDRPIRYELKDGRAVKGSVYCLDRALEQDFVRYTFQTDQNSDRVGEFAIGTNIGLKALIGNLLQDEKFPGVHIALGSPYPTKTGANWDSCAHNDGILLAPTILVGDRRIMKDGVFEPEILSGGIGQDPR